MAKNRSYEIDMCNGPLLSKMLLFALPLMLSSLLQLLFNAADIIVVGRFAGDNALAAVGSNGALINLMVNFFMGLSVGANVLAARYYASKQQKALSDTIHTAMLISIISGIFLTIFGVLAARQLLIWMDTPAEVLPLAVTYLRVYFLGMTAMMVYNFGAAILRAVGDTRRPLYFLMIAGVINVVLNLIFVIVFKMSVLGVGLATVISQCISAILILRCMVLDGGAIKLKFSELRITKDIFVRLLKIGLPASFQGILFSLSNVIIQASVNSFGSVVVAGNSAAANLEGFVYVAMNAFHQTAISFTSQNYGAGKYERINKVLIHSLICVVVVGFVFGNFVVLASNPLLGLYTVSSNVVEAGKMRLAIVCGMYFLCGTMDVMVGSLRGLGYSIMPMLVSLVGACGLRLLWIFTFFQQDKFHTQFSLYITYPVSWAITTLVHLIYFVIVRKRIDNNKY